MLTRPTQHVKPGSGDLGGDSKEHHLGVPGGGGSFHWPSLGISPLRTCRGRGRSNPEVSGGTAGVGISEWLLLSFLARVPRVSSPGHLLQAGPEEGISTGGGPGRM